MINHARTLLMNKDGSRRPGTDFYLEEYVDPLFKTLNYGRQLLELRARLVGRNPDDAYLNFRLRQYMTLLHSTEFESYVYQLDPRITYTGQSPAVTKASNVYSPLNDLAVNEMTFIGSVSPTPEKLFYTWRVTVITPFVVRTTVEGADTSVDTLVMFADDITSPVNMAGQSNFFIRLYADSGGGSSSSSSSSSPGPASLPVGAEWRVRSFVEPVDDVADVVGAIQQMDPQYLAYVFPNAEPYKTFKDLWNKQAILPYQLSGLLLAWIYRAEEERLNVGK